MVLYHPIYYECGLCGTWVGLRDDLFSQVSCMDRCVVPTRNVEARDGHRSYARQRRCRQHQKAALRGHVLVPRPLSAEYVTTTLRRDGFPAPSQHPLRRGRSSVIDKHYRKEIVDILDKNFSFI